MIGTKSDLKSQIQISYEEAQNKAIKLDMIYMETSALSSHNIYQVFENLTREITA